MNNGKVGWQGNFVAVITPFDERGEIDEPAFCANLAFLVEGGAHGVVVSGCTGEAWALTAEERLRLFRLAVDAVGQRATVIAGTGGISTQAVIDLSLAAKDVGVAGVMVLPPYYAMPGRREIIGHYDAISRAVKHPILLYNIPRRVGVNLTPDLLDELAALDWTVAVKESSGDFIQLVETVARVGARLNVFTGHSATRGVPSIVMGAKGLVSSLESQIMGRDAIEMYDLVKRGDLGRARDAQMRTLDLDQSLRSIGTFPANLKAAMNMIGRRAGTTRAPILPLSEEDAAKVRVVLERMRLIPVAV